MKILYTAYKNPNFLTITDYTETALKKRAEVRFLSDRDFIIPAALRKISPLLQKQDLLRINRNLVAAVKKFKPDYFLYSAYFRISTQAIKEIKGLGVTTILWTVDPLRNNYDITSLIKAAGVVDYIFAGGSEAREVLENEGFKDVHFLPFACVPELHKPVDLNSEEKKKYSSDVVFVGSVNPSTYALRVETLESVADLGLSIWGPGANLISRSSPLKPLIKAGNVGFEDWIKIYSGAKIALCIHYRDPDEKVPCYQASPRVYEALACKKLLLVDDQKDIRQQFEDGQHLVIFKNKQDLRENIKYYLKHPQEAAKIAQCGYEEVIKDHSYQKRIDKMLEIIKKGG